MIDNFLTSKKDGATKKSNTLNENNTIRNDTIILSKCWKCIGVANLTHGSKRKFIPLVHKCMKIQSTSSYEFSCF